MDVQAFPIVDDTIGVYFNLVLTSNIITLDVDALNFMFQWYSFVERLKDWKLTMKLLKNVSSHLTYVF